MQWCSGGVLCRAAGPHCQCAVSAVQCSAECSAEIQLSVPMVDSPGGEHFGAECSADILGS